MGIFSCDHEVALPTKIEAHGDGAIGLYGVGSGALLKVEGRCHKCQCVVSLRIAIENRYLYMWFKQQKNG